MGTNSRVFFVYTPLESLWISVFKGHFLLQFVRIFNLYIHFFFHFLFCGFRAFSYFSDPTQSLIKVGPQTLFRSR